MILSLSSVNFKKFTAVPLIIQRLITSTIQPRSSSYAGATGHSNSSLAFTFVAVQAAANVFQNAANSPNAIDTSPKHDNKLQSWPDGWMIFDLKPDWRSSPFCQNKTLPTSTAYLRCYIQLQYPRETIMFAKPMMIEGNYDVWYVDSNHACW